MKFNTSIGSTGEAFAFGFASIAVAALVIPQLGIIIFASIICTAGLGLIFWIPAMFFVGAVITGIIRLIKFAIRGASPTASTTPTKDLPPDTEAITTYIRQCRSLGFSNTIIAANLARAGWTDEKIGPALETTS